MQAHCILVCLRALIRQRLVITDDVGNGERLAARSLAGQRFMEVGRDAAAFVDVAELLRRDTEARGQFVWLWEAAELANQCGARAHHAALRTPPRAGNVVHGALAVQHCAACAPVPQRREAGPAASATSIPSARRAGVLLHVVHVHLRR